MSTSTRNVAQNVAAANNDLIAAALKDAKQGNRRFFPPETEELRRRGRAGISVSRRALESVFAYIKRRISFSPHGLAQLNQPDIARGTGRSSSTVSRAVRRLVSMKRIARRVSRFNREATPRESLPATGSLWQTK